MNQKLDYPTTADPDTQPSQLTLALRDIPPQVRAHGLQQAHVRPLCARGKGPMVRRSAREAWRWPEVELRTPYSRPALLLDVDQADPQAYLNVALGGRVPEPNWIATNPATGHAHICYCLAIPVVVGDQGRLSPQQYLARVSEYYRAVYGADRSYAGVLTHNPTHRQWDTAWLCERPRHLVELAAAIPKGWRIPAKPTTPEGRNMWLFKAAMRWFGRPSQWDASTDVGAVLAWVETQNTFHDQPPLDAQECLWISKSVCGYCRRNLASGQTEMNFRVLQSARGKRSDSRPGGLRRAELVRAANAERDAAILEAVREGESMRSVAARFNLSVGRVHKIVSQGKVGQT